MKDFKLENEKRIDAGFKTPEGYFDSIADRVMAGMPKERPKVIPLYRKTKAWLSAVAAVMLIMLGTGLFFKLGMEAETQPDNAAIENYLVYQANISNYDLYQNLDDKAISELEQSVAISDEAIEEYITSQGNYEYYLSE